VGTDFERDSKGSDKLIMLFVESDFSIRGFCGMAHIGSSHPGVTSISGDCDNKVTYEFDSYSSFAWVHETFHQLGVEHNLIPCDLMYGGFSEESPRYCGNGQAIVIDPNNELYINSDNSGVDINKLNVWKASD
jgi:hypothetical protein